MQEKLKAAWQDIFYRMEWNGQVGTDVVEYSFDETGDVVEKFLTEFTQNIQGKTMLVFEIEPRIVGERLEAKYRVW